MKLTIRDVSLEEYHDRPIKPVILKDLKNVNLFLGNNGTGKTTFCQALRGIIWREHLKKTDTPQNLYGRINGKGEFDGKEVAFSTDCAGEKDIWSGEPIGESVQSFYDLSIDSLVHSNISNYNDIKKAVGSGSLNLSDFKKVKKNDRTDIDSYKKNIDELNAEITKTVNLSDVISLKEKENEDLTKQAEELKKNIEMGKKLAEYDKFASVTEERDFYRNKTESYPPALKTIETNQGERTEIHSLFSDIQKNENILENFVLPSENKIDFDVFKDEYISLFGKTEEIRREYEHIALYDFEEKKQQIENRKSEAETIEKRLSGSEYEKIRALENTHLPAYTEVIESVTEYCRNRASGKTFISPVYFWVWTAVFAASLVSAFCYDIKFIYAASAALAASVCFGYLNMSGRKRSDAKRTPLDPEIIWSKELLDRMHRDREDLARIRRETENLVTEYENRKKTLDEVKDRFRQLINLYAPLAEYSDFSPSEFADIYRKEKEIYEKYTEALKNRKQQELLTENCKKKLNEKLVFFGCGDYEEFKSIEAKYSQYLSDKAELKTREAFLRENTKDFEDCKNIPGDIKENLMNSVAENEEEYKKILLSIERNIREIKELENESTAELIKEKEYYTKKLEEKFRFYVQKGSDAFMAETVKAKSMEYADSIETRMRELFNIFAAGKYYLDENSIIKETATGKETDLKGNDSPVDRLSKGTKSQLFLAAKMAVLENQEKDIKYPLFLDESMSGCDDISTNAVIESLKTVSEDRQIFYFSPKSYAEEEWKKVFGDEINIVKLNA